MMRNESAVEEKMLRFWVRTATDGLNEESRIAIATEIEAHFVEAVEAYEQDGMVAINAKLWALRDLGSADRARREFRRNHLTAKEADRLERMVRRPEGASYSGLAKSGYAIFMGVLLVSFFVFIAKLLNWAHPIQASCILGLLTLPFVGITALGWKDNSRLRPPKGSAIDLSWGRRAIVYRCAHFALNVLWLAMFSVLVAPGQRGIWVFPLVFACPVIWDAHFWIRLGRVRSSGRGTGNLGEAP